MNEAKRLRQVTGVDDVINQLNDFLKFKDALEMALKEMHKTIENMAERLTKAEDKESDLEPIKNELTKIKESIGRIDEMKEEDIRLNKSIENLSNEIAKSNLSMESFNKSLDVVNSRTEQSLEFKNRIRELVKYLMSD